MFSQIRQLAERIEQIAATHRPRDDGFASSGLPSLDRALPGGGLPRGAIVEYLAASAGSGAASLALAAAQAASQPGGAVVVFDRQRQFYPPAAAAWGIELARLVIVAAASEQDERWALDQTLRTPAVAAVIAWPQRAKPKDFRRWQLAAESGGSLALFLRPDSAREEPSWAAVRLGIVPQAAAWKAGSGKKKERATSFSTSHSSLASEFPARRWLVELLKCRGKAAAAVVEVSVDDATHPVPMADEVAGQRRAGA